MKNTYNGTPTKAHDEWQVLTVRPAPLEDLRQFGHKNVTYSIVSDYLKQISEPSEGAKKEALKNPNGHVYVLDKEYPSKYDVPPEAILGAWKVNEKGIITGSFIPNPNYKKTQSQTEHQQWSRDFKIKIENELLSLIREYEELVKNGNIALTNAFSLSMPPLLARRKGLLPVSGTFDLNEKKVLFRFHGIGCRFEFNSIVVEFDYTFATFEYKGFEVSKLFWFVQSHPQASQALKDRDTFDEALLWSIKIGNLKRANDATTDTHEYILCKSHIHE